jgi:hypothetical protein
MVDILEAKLKNIIGYIVDKRPRDIDFRDKLLEIGCDDKKKSDRLMGQLLYEFEEYKLNERELERALTVSDIYQTISRRMRY